MDTATFHILITGQLTATGQRPRAIAGLARMLQLEPAEADNVLRGKPTRLSTPFSRAQAERIIQRLTAHGVQCDLQASAAVKPTMRLRIPQMQCPKCGQRQPEAAMCRHCGLYIDKYTEQRRRGGTAAARRKPAPNTRNFPYAAINRTLQWVFLLSTLLAAVSYGQKDQLPKPEFYTQQVLSEPLQSVTQAQPFDIEANGMVYTIEPKFDYQLNGVLVSYHDSDAFSDIYHHQDWKDFINIRDLCVIWGDNVRSGIYRQVTFYNATWTCWVSWENGRIGQQFSMRQLSNNHLLANDPRLQQAILQAEPGDQIQFSGMLASYSHSNGQFQRGTSTTREDTGNGACETVFINDFSILKKANTGWRMAYDSARAVAALSLFGLLIVLFVAPFSRRVAR